MQDTILQSGWENFLVAVPLVGLLLMTLFRLDEMLASPKRGRAVPRSSLRSRWASLARLGENQATPGYPHVQVT
jgi:hypothetical protein